MRQSADVSKKSLDHPMLARGNEVSTGSKFTLGIKFPMRTERDFDMVDITRVATAIAFGDVRGHRNCGFAHLMGQSEPLPLRERLGDCVNQIGEIDRLLPRHQVTVAFDIRHTSVLSNLRALCVLRALAPAPFTN